MWRFACLILLVLIACPMAFSQSTTVSGTITDAGATLWKNGTYSFSFKVSASNPVGPYVWNGLPFNTAQTIAGNLDGTASFSVSVPSNTAITPAGSNWVLQLCPAASSICFVTTLTISGATQSVTSIIPPAASVNLTNPPAGVTAYNDSEITGAKTGSFYFNLTDSTIHMCSGFPPCTWISIGATTSILPSNNTFTGTNTFNNIVNLSSGGSFAGTFTGAPTMSGNWSFTGNNTHSGTETFNGAANLAAGGAFTGTFTSGTSGGGWLANPAYINNICWVDGVKYTTIDSCVNSFGSSQGRIIVPSNYSGANQSVFVNNVVIEDLRGSVSMIGNTGFPASILWTMSEGAGVNNFTTDSSEIVSTAGGTTAITGTSVTMTNGSTAVTGVGTSFNTQLAAGMSIKLNADANSAWCVIASIGGATSLTLGHNYTGTGGTGAASWESGAIGYVVGQFAGADRTGGNRPTWAMNSVIQIESGQNTNFAINQEKDFNNNSGVDAILNNDAQNQMVGDDIVSGGSNKPATAIAVRASSPPTNSWLQALSLANFHTFGVNIQGGDSGSTALQIVPPDNTSATEIIGRNAANSATVWNIQNSGNIITTGVVQATLYQTQTANGAASGAVRLANTDKVCWRNSANSADDCHGEIQSQSAAGCTTSGGASAFTGSCTTTVTWPSAFADTSYRATCTGNGVGAGVPLLQVITSQVAASVTVQTQQATGVNASFTNIQCVGVHQ